MKFLAVILSIILSFSAIANTEKNSDSVKFQLKNCGSHTSVKHLSKCIKSVYEKSDEFLNSEYKSLMNYLKENDKNNLKVAQRLWIKYRDADCQFSEPRTLVEPLITSNKLSCLTNHTIERLVQLEYYNYWQNRGCNGCPW